jgi:translocation and assembly module TamA
LAVSGIFPFLFCPLPATVRRAAVRLLSGLCMALLVCLSAPAAQAAAASYEVSIDAPRSVRSVLKSHLDLVRFSSRSDVSDEQFGFLVTAAAEQVNDLVQTEGYFSAVIKTDVRSPAKGRKRVVISVDPGPRTTIGSIDLQFHGPVASEEPSLETTARLAWSLHAGDPFTQSDWAGAKNATLKALQSRRYLAARIAHSDAQIDPRTHQAALSVDFDSGPTFRFGQIHLSGVQRYPQAIVSNIDPIRPGEIYTAAKVQELQRQIQNTPYYSSVAIDVADDPAHQSATPVNVKLSEYPYQNVRGGVGYSTNTGPSVQGSYQYNNVFNRAWVFTVQGLIEPDTQNGSISLAMPPDAKSYVNSVLASYTRTDYEDTDIHSVLIGVQRARSLASYDWTYSLMLYEDRLYQNSAAPTISRALVPGWSWTRRNTDDPVFPSSGNLLHAEAGFAVKGLLTDQTFARVYLHGKQYLPLDKTDLLVLRAEFGGVFTGGSSNGVPASLLFRAGGADSVRGYSYESIGNNVDGSVLPTKYLVTGSTEYQHWFTHEYGGAIFYDIGTATDTWAEKAFYQGVGVGARWRSPIGPVNLDLAYGLRNRSIRPYLTLGIAF